MREILVIGIGAGDPDHITVAGHRRPQPGRGRSSSSTRARTRPSCVALRDEICRPLHPRPGRLPRSSRSPSRPRPRRPAAYARRRRGLARAPAPSCSRRRSLEHLGDDGVGAFLVWGDPALYDSTLRIIDRILARGAVQFEYHVIPGITSVQALTAQHRTAAEPHRRADPHHHRPPPRRAGLPAGLRRAPWSCSTRASPPPHSTSRICTSTGAPTSARRTRSCVSGRLRRRRPSEIATPQAELRRAARLDHGHLPAAPRTSGSLPRPAEYRWLSGNRSAASTRPTMITAVRRMPASRTCVGDVGQGAAQDDLVGPAGIGDDGDRAVGAVVRAAARRRRRRCAAPPGAARAWRRSGRAWRGPRRPASAVARAAIRVSTTVWPTPGTVSSRRSAAAAAAKAGTPGRDVVGHARPRRGGRICSAIALNTDGSPEHSRATSCPAACAATSSATISSRVRSRGVDQPGAGRAVLQQLGRHQAARRTGTPGTAASSRRARRVIRSAAPGPAPMKWTVTRARLRSCPLGHRHRRAPAGEPADRFGPLRPRSGSARRRGGACQSASTASVSTVTALATSRPPGRSAAQQASSTPGAVTPPPTKIASGRGQPGQRLRAPRPATIRSPGTPERARRSRRSGPRGPRADSMAIARQPGGARIHSMPIAARARRRRPTAAGRARGASAARVTARTSRLVSWPSWSKASSGRPGGAAGSGAAAARHATHDVERIGQRVVRQSPRALSTRSLAPGRPAAPARSSTLAPSPAPTSSAATPARSRRRATSTSSRRPGCEHAVQRLQRAADRADHVDVLAAASRAGRRPARPTTGAADPHRVRAEQPHQGDADAEEHRVAAGQHHEPAPGARPAAGPPARQQRRRPRLRAWPAHRVVEQPSWRALPSTISAVQQRVPRPAGEPGPPVGADPDDVETATERLPRSLIGHDLQSASPGLSQLTCLPRDP